MTYEQALNKAASYCSKAERAPQDVIDKLHDWKVEETDVDKIVDWLKMERFLSEERFVHAYVNDKFIYERWGRIKISYSLRQKGIEGSLVQNALEEVIGEDKYLETLVDLLRGKMKGMSFPLDQKNRAKLYRFAVSRGFESSYYSKALQQLKINEEVDD